MKTIARILTLLALATLLPLGAAAQGKKLKVFILAGQSNMEGPARVETFDYIGDDPATAPLLKQMRYFLDSHHKDHANADGKMTEEQKRDFIKKFEANLTPP